MDKKYQVEATYVRSLSSEDAATYLMEQYGDEWPATLKSRSWEKKDQFRLARRFIKGRALATDRGYREFLPFMSIEAFLRVIEEGLQDIEVAKLELLSYHLLPCLRGVALTKRQVSHIENFEKRLSSLQS